ncbi:MAG TPA: glycoside hydrolase family 57 protein [Candidatus Saccharimonadales bacterium]|nr:glycoside hydrolase family 57 protein [Candidatus Saccharimonadales bacterium]
MSKAIVLYLHVHQPYRVRPYTIFDIAKHHDYFAAGYEDNTSNERIVHKVAEKSYIPTNTRLLQMLNEHPEFRLSLSITGTIIEQLERWAPEALQSFKDLVATGRVEIVAETYHHSLAFFYSHSEFEAQVKMHARKVQEVFGQTPQVFRNTELAYNNDVAAWADKAGYKGVLAEGWDDVLGWRSPNFVYRPANTDNIRLLMKNYQLSDDIAFRFSDQSWEGYPLTADKFSGWLNNTADAQVFNLFMDYETFGEHQWGDTGIFDFLSHLPAQWLAADKDNTFMTVSEAVDSFEPAGDIDNPQTTTWADTERDLSAWVGNGMQQNAIASLYELQGKILGTGDLDLIEDWRRLQTSDHVYYMSTKEFNDGSVHSYFSPYANPYDAFIYFMNAYHDLRYRLTEKGIEI